MLSKNVLNEWKKKDELYPEEIYILEIAKTKIPLVSRWGHRVGHNVGVAKLHFPLDLCYRDRCPLKQLSSATRSKGDYQGRISTCQSLLNWS